jgi:hypothetical protein
MSKLLKTPKKNEETFCLDISNKKNKILLMSENSLNKNKEDFEKDNTTIKFLRKCLKEEKNKNKILNEKVAELEALLANCYDVMEEKDEAICELYLLVDKMKNKLDNIIENEIQKKEKINKE